MEKELRKIERDDLKKREAVVNEFFRKFRDCARNEFFQQDWFEEIIQRRFEAGGKSIEVKMEILKKSFSTSLIPEQKKEIVSECNFEISKNARRTVEEYFKKNKDKLVAIVGKLEFSNQILKNIIFKEYGISGMNVLLFDEYFTNDKHSKQLEQIKNPKYIAMLIGPMAHKVQGVSGFGITNMTTTEGYPPSFVMKDKSGEIKFTATSLRYSLFEMINKIILKREV